MAVTIGVLTEVQRRTLEAVCDTFAPAIESDEPDATMREFLARPASELGVAAQMEGLMAQGMTAEEIAGLGEVLDALAGRDFADAPREARTQLLHGFAASGAEVNLALTQLRQLTFFFFYGLPDPATGQNPNWAAIGYPGPIGPPPSAEEAPKTIAVELLPDGEHTLTADAVVVGSGAGGGVIAAKLAQAGRSVVVLEMGGYRNEQDFDQLELPGMLKGYLGGGLMQSEDGSMSILAGSTLGGGTVINYLNCLPTPDNVRREWAGHGLDGLDTDDFDRHMAEVFERLEVNDDATTHNRTHQKLIAAFEASGLDWAPIRRNARPNCDDPEVCGYCFVGCQRGCKRSTLKTYLQDAADAGARFVVGAYTSQVIVGEDGRAAGVAAALLDENAQPRGSLTVEAPTVVVAGGSVESPALLLRSGIGGPAVGKHLRLHPASLVTGVYDESIEGWRGQIQSAVSHELNSLADGHGFIFEATYVAPALFSASYPWSDGEEHKRNIARTLQHTAPFITVARDHGEGEVALKPDGRPLVRWSLRDEVDRRLLVQAQVELCKLHRVAGAREIQTLHTEQLRWTDGEDFEGFLRGVESAPYGPLDVGIFSAHQMGSCRMGSDPAESVADGRGELHDVPGAWIGDASAFPTAPGVNPMISIMALASRTAEKILAAAA